MVPRVSLTAETARRLLALATDSRDAIRRAIAVGNEPEASDAERRTAERAKACMDELARKIQDLDRAIATLEAFSTGEGASLDLAEVQAIELFVGCAAPLLSKEKSVVTVAAGLGLPLVVSIAISLLGS